MAIIETLETRNIKY